MSIAQYHRDMQVLMQGQLVLKAEMDKLGKLMMKIDERVQSMEKASLQAPKTESPQGRFQLPSTNLNGPWSGNFVGDMDGDSKFQDLWGSNQLSHLRMPPNSESQEIHSYQRKATM